MSIDILGKLNQIENQKNILKEKHYCPVKNGNWSLK